MNKLYVLLILSVTGYLLNGQCIPPTAFYATNIEFTSVDITWSGGTPPAEEHIVNYRKLNDTVWLGVSVFDDSTASLYSLDSCTGYEFNITSICDFTNEATTPNDTFYTKCDTSQTSLIAIFYNPAVVVYPNPAHGLINVKFDEPVYGDVYIFVRNGSGMLVSKTDLFMSGENQVENISTGGDNKSLNYITIIYNGKLYSTEIFQTEL